MEETNVSQSSVPRKVIKSWYIIQGHSPAGELCQRPDAHEAFHSEVETIPEVNDSTCISG